MTAIQEPIRSDKICISEHEYSQFKKAFGARKHGDKRFGQAFFDHFKLEQHEKRACFDNLYNLDDLHGCVKIIRANFIFTGPI